MKKNPCAWNSDCFIIAPFATTFVASNGSVKGKQQNHTNGVIRRCILTYDAFRAKVIAITLSIFPAPQPDLVIRTNGQF